jgi:ABC-2 type transport system permease protein
MKKDILFFIAQTKVNLKNSYALKSSFWIGVVSMILNNISFFVIWLFFMKATGPINGWTSMDVFGMLGVSMMCFGITHGFFNGVVDLPKLVLRGSFDSVLLSPVSSLFKLAGSSFSVVAYGDLLMGTVVAIFYGVYMNFSLYLWALYLFAILLGSIVFICIRLICSSVVFFLHDAEVVSTQLFELFLRPGLYPGSIFPNKLKIFFMTIIPALVTSAVPIDIVKYRSFNLIIFAVLITLFWVFIATVFFKISVRRYESGNFLR